MTAALAPLRPTSALAAAWRLGGQAWRAAVDRRHAFEPDRLDRRDAEFVATITTDLLTLARSWLGLRTEGLEHLAGGPCLYVGNHNGGIMGPDLFCTLGTLWSRLGPAAPLYSLAHDFAMRHVTPLGRLLQRTGALRACPENARAALDRGGSVLVYPGGDLDAFRHFSLRDRVIFGSRTGFVRIAQEAGVPIVPIVAQGAHRSAIIFHEGAWLARALGLRRFRLERFPIALALPWGIAPGPWMPYAPLPFPIQLRVLPPIAAPRDAVPEAIRDRVVREMQRAMDELSLREGARTLPPEAPTARDPSSRAEVP